MCGTVMRGADALPRPKTPSRTKRSRRNLGPKFGQRRPAALARIGKAREPKPATHERGKSDPAIGATKSANKAGRPAAEPVERRAGAEGNADQQSTLRTQSRERATKALDRVRQAARQGKQGKKQRFTALLRQVNADTLRLAFYALKRKAAPGVDGVTWQDCETELEPRLEDLHRRVRRGA
ncbi:MAG: hypothetical protein ACR2KT_04695 [Methylocella sp.]